MSRQVLVCGDERLLLRTRDMVLSRAGLSVVSACTRAEIASISKVPAVELGIIGHSLTAAEQREVAQDVRERWPAFFPQEHCRPRWRGSRPTNTNPGVIIRWS